MVASIGDRTTLSVGADEVKQLARSHVGQPDVKDLEFASAAHLPCGPARGALDELPTTAMPWNSPHVLRTVRTCGQLRRRHEVASLARSRWNREDRARREPHPTLGHTAQEGVAHARAPVSV